MRYLHEVQCLKDGTSRLDASMRVTVWPTFSIKSNSSNTLLQLVQAKLSKLVARNFLLAGRPFFIVYSLRTPQQFRYSQKLGDQPHIQASLISSLGLLVL